MAWCSPTRLWQAALAKTVRPEDFEAGEVSPLVKTGGGSGTAQLVRAFPKDAYAVRVRVVVQGELGTAKVVTSLDGQHWSYPRTLPTDGVLVIEGTGALRLEDTGLTLVFAGGSAPSFVVDALWAFETTASPTITAKLQAAEDELAGLIACDLSLPLLPLAERQTIAQDLPEKVADIATWKLLVYKGFNPLADHNRAYVMAHDAALAWGRDVREKLRRLQVAEGGPPVAGIRASSLRASGWGTIRGGDRG